MVYSSYAYITKRPYIFSSQQGSKIDRARASQGHDKEFINSSMF